MSRRIMEEWLCLLHKTSDTFGFIFFHTLLHALWSEHLCPFMLLHEWHCSCLKVCWSWTKTSESMIQINHFLLWVAGVGYFVSLLGKPPHFLILQLQHSACWLNQHHLDMLRSAAETSWWEMWHQKRSTELASKSIKSLGGFQTRKIVHTNCHIGRPRGLV